MKILIFFFWVTISAFAQKTSISAIEMKQDLDYLNKHLRKWHPTYYAYRPKLEMDAFYTKTKANLDSSLSLRQFSNIVKTAVSKIGCGHMSVQSGNAANRDSILAIPFDVNVLCNSLFIRTYFRKDSRLTVGDEILSINGFKTDSLLQNLENFKTSDGFNITHKKYAIEFAFFIFNYFAFGESKTYQITKKNVAGTIESIELEAINRSTTFSIYQRNTVDSSQILLKGAHINLQKTDISPNTFLVDFNSFSGPHLRKTYRQIFSYLHKNNADNLILDFRDNGGGNAFGGYNFMKYLIKKPVQFLNLSRKPNLTVLNPNFKSGFFERITPVLFMLNPFQYPSRQGWNHAFPFVRHFRNFYQNNIYVITNGQSFSMTALTATLLKNKTKAVFVGEETGGSSYASRGMAQGKIKLPNSGFLVSFNTYQLKYGTGKDTGSGIIPDYPIQYTFEDRQLKRDLELEKIKELIQIK